MPKALHEIRDPIHVFVRVDGYEREVLNSPPVQRLRNIHQLALTSLVYPAATHKRFEHSLGVMELAGRVFDVITANIRPEVRELLPDLVNEDQQRYWRRVLRMAALCHDIGHLPFSHAAEHALLPSGWNHERLTRALIESSEMASLWGTVTPPLRAEDLVKLAVGKKQAKDLTFSPLEELLSEVVVGDAFGVDRIDYLLRDSHHVGVAYGKFDHYRLIDTLRVLVPPEGGAPVLGIEEGGLLSSDALLLARYYMFSQVYQHSIRIVYDLHLQQFLEKWLKGGQFSVELQKHQAMTDNEVLAAMHEAARIPSATGDTEASRIVERAHFKVAWSRNPEDVRRTPDAGRRMFDALSDEFGAASVMYSKKVSGGGSENFPVLMKDGRITSSVGLSDTLTKLPVIAFEYVFVDRDQLAQIRDWIQEKRDQILDTEVGKIQKLQKASVITELADQLRSEGSWCGETHLQKAVYLLQELLGVQLGYDFVLYRFGPFSFDLRDDLTELQADELLEPLPSPPYGPSLVPTDISRRLRSRVSISKQDADKIHFVASRLQDKWVTDLESLATALYVWKTEGIDSVDGIAREVQKLKPHVSDEQAYKAAEELLQIAKDSESFRN